MGFRVIPTNSFIKELKRISKKHRTILKDIAELSDLLKKNPTYGTDLGRNVYKIRLAISGTNKGKSGGARIVTCVVFVSEVVFLSEIYLKNETDSVDIDRLIKRLQDDKII